MPYKAASFFCTFHIGMLSFPSLISCFVVVFYWELTPCLSCQQIPRVWMLLLFSRCPWRQVLALDSTGIHVLRLALVSIILSLGMLCPGCVGEKGAGRWLDKASQSYEHLTDFPCRGEQGGGLFSSSFSCPMQIQLRPFICKADIKVFPLGWQKSAYVLLCNICLYP